DRHEGRRLDVAVGGGHPPAARAAVGVRHVKSERHVLSLFAMTQLRVGVIYGGRSGEHEVSLASAASVFQNLDPARYEAIAIRIEKDGRWTLPPEPPKVMKAADVIKGAGAGGAGAALQADRAAREAHPVAFPGGDTLTTGSTGVKLDVVFPVLHGPYGEDGTVQGLLELANVPYVGAGVLA